jgi:hypothetical protein
MSDEASTGAKSWEAHLLRSLEELDRLPTELARFSRELASFRENVLQRLDRLEASVEELASAQWKLREGSERDQRPEERLHSLGAEWEIAWENYHAQFGQPPPINLADLQSNMLGELALWLRAATNRGRPWTADSLRHALGLLPQLPLEVEPK